MRDEDLRKNIVAEIHFEPSVDATNIGVNVKDGIVTLTGHVRSYAEKFATERAVRRVRGVRAIAEEIEVQYPDAKKTADDQIAARALKILAWDTTIPHETIQITVQKGLVTLTGYVGWYFQKDAAESAIRKLSGVIGIDNSIEVKPPIEAGDVKGHIENALRRNAEVEAGGLQVLVSRNRVILYGRVHSWRERDAVARAAWSVPGVVQVENNLSID